MTAPSLPSINDYGSGVLQDAVPLVDPASEISASDLNKLRNDAAAANQTVAKAIFQFVGATTPSIPIASTATWTSGFDSQWGSNPLYYPSITRGSQVGVLTVQFPPNVPDFLTQTNSQLVNNSIPVIIRTVKCWVSSGTQSAHFICNVTSASTFTINILNLSGTNVDLVGSLITVQAF